MDPSHRRLVDATVSDHPTAHGASIHSQKPAPSAPICQPVPLLLQPFALRGSVNGLPVDQHVHMIDAALHPVAETACIAELTDPFDRSLTVRGMATPDSVDKSETLARRRAEAFGVLLPHRSPSTSVCSVPGFRSSIYPWHLGHSQTTRRDMSSVPCDESVSSHRT